MGAYERQAKEEEIINAAVKVFLAKGFSSAKMIDIPKEAEISKGSLYFYYKIILEEKALLTVENSC